MPYSQFEDFLVKELILQKDQLWFKTWPSNRKTILTHLEHNILPEDGSITKTPSWTAILERFLN